MLIPVRERHARRGSAPSLSSAASQGRPAVATARAAPSGSQVGVGLIPIVLPQAMIRARGSAARPGLASPSWPPVARTSPAAGTGSVARWQAGASWTETAPRPPRLGTLVRAASAGCACHPPHRRSGEKRQGRPSRRRRHQSGPVNSDDSTALHAHLASRAVGRTPPSAPGYTATRGRATSGPG